MQCHVWCAYSARACVQVRVQVRLHAIEVIDGERRAVAGRGGRHDRRPLRVAVAGGRALLLLPREVLAPDEPVGLHLVRVRVRVRVWVRVRVS